MTDPAGSRVVLVTAPDEAVAESIVRRLVQERVVACGNVVPRVTSIYRWQGEVTHEAEALIVFKTTAAGAARLLERVPELHPYEVPEVLVLDVAEGHGPYLDWITENVAVSE